MNIVRMESKEKESRGGEDEKVQGEREEEAPEASDDTFHQWLSIHLDHPVGSMSMSPYNRDVALGARKGLFIVDLENPYDPPRYLPYHSAWQVADLQWSPFPQRAQWVASTFHQHAIIYNLSYSPALTLSPIQHTLKAHTRAVTDINWSPFSCDVLATSALDGWVLAWDLRSGNKPVWGVSSFGSGATQVKWNRHEPHVVASAHGRSVLIWDDRHGARPLETIEGHDSKIYGIDWSRQTSRELVTCSLDKSFKFWDRDQPAEPVLSMLTASPVWRARNLPFGSGLLTLPQRNDTALTIWSRSGKSVEQVARFEGAREGVKEFVWRTRGGADSSCDDRQFQLVTWAKDRRLRLWPLSDAIVKQVGHVPGSAITIPITRSSAENVSFRTLPAGGASPAGESILPVAPRTTSTDGKPPKSLLTNSLLSGKGGASTASSVVAATAVTAATASPQMRQGTMMTTTSIKFRREKQKERLEWMEGVKVEQTHVKIADDELEAELEDERAERKQWDATTESLSPFYREIVHNDSAAASTIGPNTSIRTEDNDPTERASNSVVSKTTGTVVGKDLPYNSLGEEIVSVVKKFPKVNFEKVHIAARTCVVSLYGPQFIRATFTFPKGYPFTASPTIDIERNSVDMSQKHRALLLLHVRKLLTSRLKEGQEQGRGLPSFEYALRYLLGDTTYFDVISDARMKRKRAPTTEALAVDDDDDTEDEDIATFSGDLGPDGQPVYNVPPPRRGGAVFGPQGQLVVFFPNIIYVSERTGDGVDTDSISTLSGYSSADDAHREVSAFQISETFGSLHSAHDEDILDATFAEIDDAFQRVENHGRRPKPAQPGSGGTSLRLRPEPTLSPMIAPSSTMINVPFRGLDTRPSSPTALLSPSLLNTTVFVMDFAKLTLARTRPDAGTSVLGDVDTCSIRFAVPHTRASLLLTRECLARARASRDVFMTKLWTTIEICITHDYGDHLRGSSIAAGRRGSENSEITLVGDDDSAESEKIGDAPDFVKSHTNDSPLQSVMAQRLLPDLVSYLVHLKDIETLGLVSCVLELHVREHARSVDDTFHALRETAQLEAMQLSVEKTVALEHASHPGPEQTNPVDYFSLKSNTAAATLSPMIGGPGSPAVPTSATKPSWANLSGIFSLRPSKNTSSVPETPASNASTKRVTIVSDKADERRSAGERQGQEERQSSRERQGLDDKMTDRLSPAEKSPPNENGEALLKVFSHPDLTSHTTTPTPPAFYSQPGTPKAYAGAFGRFGSSATFKQGELKGRRSHSLLSPLLTPLTPGTRLGSLYPPAKRRHTKDSARATTGKVHILKVDEELSSSTAPWWEAEHVKRELLLVRLAYAELLYRLGLNYDRLKVLKLCHPEESQTVAHEPSEGDADKGAPSSQPYEEHTAQAIRAANGYDFFYGLDLVRCCPICNTLMMAPNLEKCSKCERRNASTPCVICHLPIKMLAQGCVMCGHIGHLECMEQWYDMPSASSTDTEGDSETEDEDKIRPPKHTKGVRKTCPTGCGCHCIQAAGTHGHFLSGGRKKPLQPSLNYTLYNPLMNISS